MTATAKQPKQTPKPEPIKPDPTGIPDELKQLDQWIVWKLAQRRGQKWTKPPYNPKTGKAAKVNDPSTWATFDEAWSAYSKGGWDGIGLVLKPDADLVAFDFDHCLQDGEINPDAAGMVMALGTYAERSPIDGLRAFAFGKIPGERRRKGPLEIYSGDRYVTITGRKLPDAPDRIERRDAEIIAFYREHIGNDADTTKTTNTTTETPPTPPPEGIEDRLQRAFRSKDGAKIKALYDGHWAAKYSSLSEATMALLNQLAFWLGKDPAAMDSAFRASGLMRDKWDEKRGAKTWGQLEIEKAIAKTTNVYVPQEKQTQRGSAEKWVAILSRKHAVCMVGGQCRILNEFTDPITEQPDISFSTTKDFFDRYANQTVYNPETKRECQAARYWFNSKDRRQYDGVVFSPEKPVKGYYNLWRGFATTPKPGKWDLMREHIYENIVKKNEDYFKWFLAWFARIFQYPGGERPGTAIVLQGRQGTGKGIFVNQFPPIFGSHFLRISHQKHLTGNFNHHLKDALMVFCDEAFWAGSKKDSGPLKTMITEPELLIEGKGRDIFAVKNHVNLVMASNENWVVPADMDDRRFFVLEIDDAHAQDHAYFKGIAKQMNTGGREAMFHDLKNLDISGINLRSAPRTIGLFHQIIESFSPFQQFWFNALNEGINRTDSTGYETWETRIDCNEIRSAYIDFANEMGAKGYRLSNEQFGRRLHRVCPGVDKVRKPSGTRSYEYKLPPLEECRKAFQAQMRMEITWDYTPEETKPAGN